MSSMEAKRAVGIEIAGPFAFALLEAWRYKVWYGGRGGAKSWQVARLLLVRAYQRKTRILCVREFQNSIADSVHRLLCDQIALLGLSDFFSITNNSIKSACGSEFIFKGLVRSIHEIKSLEGVDICWFEEAQRGSKLSWEILGPTIRKNGSEIWVTFNPDEESDPTYQKFVIDPPPDAKVILVNYYDNPWLPETLRLEMEYCRAANSDDYRHIWLGECRRRSSAEVFGGKWVVDAFEVPPDAVFYYGADWGFSHDPTVLMRCFERDADLYIDREAWGIGVDISDTPDLFRSVPGAETWPIKADSARPETISALRRAGFNITAAPKWPGSVQDGIIFLRGYRRIVIHERCKHMIDEAKLYRYKTDPKTGEVLPVLMPGNDHCIDALRYALSGRIRQGGGGKIVARVAGL